MASRTLLVNPIETQKQAYLLANEALETVIKALKVGEPLKNAFKAGKQLILGKKPDFANKIHSSLGFGVLISLLDLTLTL